MSVGSKVAGFAALLRIFLIAFPEMGDGWIGAMAILATLTLIIGNVVAIAQKNIKRLLAYSSIAHAGYILIALAVALNSQDGVSSVLFYLFVYLFSNLGAFAIVIALEKKQGEGCAAWKITKACSNAAQAGRWQCRCSCSPWRVFRPQPVL